VHYDLAMNVMWLNSVETQQKILTWHKHGAPLFYPSSAEWKAAIRNWKLVRG
jgi:hypothetical protein